MWEIFKLDNELGESEKWIQHYSSHHKILLVGEGDFSFAACLAKSFGSADNMGATSLDSKGTNTFLITIMLNLVVTDLLKILNHMCMQIYNNA